jgi:hypothetical protein
VAQGLARSGARRRFQVFCHSRDLFERCEARMARLRIVKFPALMAATSNEAHAFIRAYCALP